MSRYGSRYEGDRRSRSPRDRSSDRYDRASVYSDGDRRRPSGEPRANSAAFSSNRDGFRDSFRDPPLGREPPRGPKALLDAPSGPRGGGYAGDFRGRGRIGRGGRGWRDDSRDRGRDRDEFRDRRDAPRFRGEDRSQERGDWRDRDRDRDNFRGRRPSPIGRGRSPPGRDFRDREPPSAVDAERARRESRDGLLSAGSSASDPTFASQAFRGGFSRGRGRGARGDWDRGRGRGGFYDDRDRYPRSRSQESRWARDRDDRDGHRYPDSENRPIRDPREDKDARERDPIRPKVDRNSASRDPLQPAKDVSPPPIAPSAPAFGSVPSRNPSVADIPSVTGKPPPTGPRSLIVEERPISATQVGERLPPTGPSKPTLPDVGPLVPTGPRAHQAAHQARQAAKLSSKQWINPGLTSKKPLESPKFNRSQSFAPQQPQALGTRPKSSHSDHHEDLVRRPRSSDAKTQGQASSADGRVRSPHPTGPGGVVAKTEKVAEPDRMAIDREARPGKSDEPSNVVMSPVESKKMSAKSAEPDATPGEVKTQGRETARESIRSKKPRTAPGSVVRFALPPKHIITAPPDPSSESDDEDIDDYFDMEIAKAEAELNKLENSGENVPTEIVARYAVLSHESMALVATENEDLTNLLGDLPVEESRPDDKIHIPTKEPPSEEAVASSREKSSHVEAVLVSREKVPVSDMIPDGLQPKVEDMETDDAHQPIPTIEHVEARMDDGDVIMEDALPENGLYTSDFPPGATQVNGTTPLGNLPDLVREDQRIVGKSSLPPVEDDDDATEIEEIDYKTLETIRDSMKTPALDDLPDYSCASWYQDREFIDSMQPMEEMSDFIGSRVQHEFDITRGEQEKARGIYGSLYESYLRFTFSDDPVAVKSREYFMGVGPTAAAKPAPVAEPKPEGRRTGSRFATERDIERVMQESRREEEEKRERAERAERERYRTEKEAVIPDMYWTSEERDASLFVDKSGYLPAENLVSTWQVLPPVVNFTEEESQLFEKAYLEFPKQWGKIAEQVPSRDFKACIQYYYSMKRELKLKEKLKKQPRRRKKGRKARSSALVTEVRNNENEAEETPAENGENGERRRPRRAAAPSFGVESTPAADSDGNTPAGTPGGRRRGEHAAKNESGADKPESKRGRKRATKDKEPRAPKPQALAPTPPGTSKGNRSRSSSRAQAPEWQASQALQDVARLPAQFEMSAPSGGMQLPLVSGQPVSGNERTPPAPSSISEVMAPPALRPDPPVPTTQTFEIGPPDRIRTPQQASSYWSVSETNDFPGLLKSFGTDWNGIANHMQTKTAVMVKNFFVRKKDVSKVEWEMFADEADMKRVRGEKLPAPPAPSQGARKRYDTVPSVHRPLAAAESIDEVGVVKAEGQALPQQPFAARFQTPVAIAQAPGPHQGPTISAGPQISQPVPQAMSPGTRPLRAPLAPFAYPERDIEASASQPPARLIQKASPVGMSLVSEPGQQRGTYSTADVDAQLLQLSAARQHRQSRERAEMQQREESQHVERQQPRLPQEEAPNPYDAFAAPQPSRLQLARHELTPVSRGAEPRGVAPATHSYPPPQQQPVSSLLGELNPASRGGAPDHPMSGLARPISTPVQDPYKTPTPQPHRLAVAPAPAPSRAPERKTSNLMALLNDEPPAPQPKRVGDVAGSLKSSSTPPPQAMSSRPPPSQSAVPPLRREAEAPFSPYSRNPPQLQSAIPSLKPYNPTLAQSPQPQQLSAPRSSILSPVDSAAAERDYYSRHPYQPQHQGTGSGSPQTHQYPPPAQQSQMVYQPSSAYQGYGAQVAQPHSASPTLQYAVHTSASGRREPPAPGRETSWPPPPQNQGMAPSQQNPAALQQQAAWPSSASSHQPPKASQPPPQSPWASQHATPKPPSTSAGMAPQSSWPTTAPQAPPHPMSLRDIRDDRGSSVYQTHDARSPVVQHQHQGSLSGRYVQPSVSRNDVPQAAQPGYARYSNTPNPGQVQDTLPRRSYTPVSGYDHRQPPPNVQYPSHEQQMREMQIRDMGRDPRDSAQQPAPSILQRQLRPHDDYNRPPERYR